MKKVALIIFSLLLPYTKVWAQCAMCKTTIVNNVSHGELSLAEGLNFGIMYLFFTPYLAILVIGILWYKKSKSHGKKKLQ
ncbi:MAG: hypothetical protein ABJF11_11230 [Reichenbachiella sp.]|uniref:hypothetical protein n=1 Tax=Reichenbachiella sp. TaxID=2184521 RepID=UPI0032640824